MLSAPRIGALPAQRFWDPSFLTSIPGLVIADDRQGAPADNIFWAGNLEEAGAVWHAYQSAWLPASLLEDRPAPKPCRCAVRGGEASGA